MEFMKFFFETLDTYEDDYYLHFNRNVSEFSLKNINIKVLWWNDDNQDCIIAGVFF